MSFASTFLRGARTCARACASTCVLAVGLLCSSGALADTAAVDFERFESLEPLGDSTALAAAPQDGVLLLQFWASWCHSCGALMWDMDELVSGNEQVSYLAVSLDDDPKAADAYVRRLPVAEKHPGSYFLDENKALAASLGVETVPSILLVTPDGEVLVHKTGHLNSSDLQAFVRAFPTP